MAPSSALSQTLKSITVTKIRELRKQKQNYNESKDTILKAAANTTDIRNRISLIRERLTTFKLLNDPTFRNLKGWIDQAEFDPTVQHEKLVQCEKELLQRLYSESRKLDLADLYSRLLMEWIEKSSGNSAEPPGSESSLDEVDAFEVVQSAQRERLDQLREKFARVIFEPLETDGAEIEQYLGTLFKSEKGEEALQELRKEMNGRSCELYDYRIDRKHLVWMIRALQKNDLLNDEKKSILQEFLKDEAVLGEIEDVLNMRLKDIDNWSWDMEGEGMPVVPRQSLNGKWRVVVDDDIMQALLTHFVGTHFAIRVKEAFRDMITYKHIWKYGNHASEEEKKTQLYFRPVTYPSYDTSVEEYSRQRPYQKDFFLAPLPFNMFEQAGGYDDDDDDDDDEDVDNDSKRTSPKEIKQLLLRTLATETLVRQAFDGEFAVVQSDFQWFSTGISHNTVFTILKFIGFADGPIAFIRKVLEPPIDMLDGSPVKPRKRGLPMAHIFEKLCGEMMLFFMDLAVNQEASQLLYRFHDDLWLVGQPERCAKAWTAMKKFAKIMGLEFNHSKTGSVYFTNHSRGKNPSIAKALPEGPVEMDFLVLDPDSGEWTINHDHVQKHVEQLRKQLGQAKSVFDWIKTWNSCIGRFFSYTFGEPAQCFGSRHLKAILETHQKMQHFLFDGKDGNSDNVSAHVKNMIATRTSTSADLIPDAFLYLPESFGGLGLKNPFINLSLVRNQLNDSPISILHTLLETEKEKYEKDKKFFYELSERHRRSRWKACFAPDGDDPESGPPALSWSDAQTFPSLEFYTKHREAMSADLRQKYDLLMSTPVTTNSIQMTKPVELALRAIDAADGANGKYYNTVVADQELVWLLEFYRDDLFREFGGLRCVEKYLLPLGVLGTMRNKKVTWQMGL